MNRSMKATVLAFGVMLISGCAGGGATPAPVAVAPSISPIPLVTPTPVGLQTPSTSAIYLGAFVAASNGSIATVETQIGRSLAMDMHYYQWVGLFPGALDEADIAGNRYAIDSWNCGISSAQVVSGSADMLILTRALAIKSYGRPVFLRYMWDMNLPSMSLGRASCYDPSTDNADGSFSASQFVAAWKHIRQIFAQANVTNVVWVWDVAAAGSDPNAYYPGDSEVDWVGLDVYNAGNVDPATLLLPLYAKLAQFDKPILLAEVGTRKSTQRSFFPGVVPTLKSNLPLIKGFIYYDGFNSGTDWGISASALPSFSALAADPYFEASASL